MTFDLAVVNAVRGLAQRKRWLRLLPSSGQQRSFEALAKLLLSADTSEFVDAERAVKAYFNYRENIVGRPREIAQIECGWAGHAVLSWHPSGYFREEAIKELLHSTSPLLLPLLTLRAVDWVKEVRDLAESGIEGHLPDIPLEQIVQALPLIARVLQTPRGKASETIPQIVGKLADSDAVEIVAPLSRLSARGRRAVYKLILNDERLHKLAFLEAALADNDAGIRSVAAGLIANSISIKLPLALCLAASQSRDAHLRQASLVAMCRDWPEAAPEVLTHLQWDSALAVLTTCHFFLRKLDLLDLERQRLALEQGSPKLLVPALVGLGLSGAEEDTALVAPFLKHKIARVRWSALISLGVKRAETYTKDVIECLGDSNWRVRSQAEKYLAQTNLGPHTEHLVELASHSPKFGELRALIRLLMRLPLWDVLMALLKIRAQVSGEMLAEVDEALVQGWKNRAVKTFTYPSPAQRTELSGLLDVQPPGEALSKVMDELLHRLRH